MKVLNFITAILSFAWCMFSCAKQTADEGTLELTMAKNSLGSSASYFWIGIQTEESISWTLSLSFEEGGTSWATLRDSVGIGNKLIACDYKKNESEASRLMTINLTSAGGKTTSYSIAQSGNLPPGSMPGWMELPEPRSEYLFVPHQFKKGYYTYRNYSIGYSEKDRLSVWVAYPLNSFYTNGGVGRAENWRRDSVLYNNIDSKIYQPCLVNGYISYSGEIIERGHQIPSADRQCCDTANIQTFYFTNSTPQRKSFNHGVWLTLEGKVRSFSAKCDTLYVVTGAIVGNSQQYAYDNKNNPCPVPAYYYKALLAYKKSSTFGHSGYQAVGYWLDHSTSSQTRMSIRSLEAKVGFDLFPNLKKAVGESLYETIETETPSSFWN